MAIENTSLLDQGDNFLALRSQVSIGAGEFLRYNVYDYETGVLAFTGDTPGPINSFFITDSAAVLTPGRTYILEHQQLAADLVTVLDSNRIFATTYSAVQDISAEGDGGVTEFIWCGRRYSTANDNNWVRYSPNNFNGYGTTFIRPANDGVETTVED